MMMLMLMVQGNENYTGMAARETANALRVLASAVRGVAATSADRELQDSIVDHARDVMDKSANLIEEAKKAVMHPQNPENQTRLAQVCGLSLCQGDHLSGKPGNVREFDSCQGNVRDFTKSQGNVGEKILSGKSYLQQFIVSCLLASMQVFSKSLFGVKY